MPTETSAGRSQLDRLAEVLKRNGCPAGKSAAMAAQLDRRARQLAGRKQRTYEQALAHLLGLLSRGWAARGGGEPGPAGPSSH